MTSQPVGPDSNSEAIVTSETDAGTPAVKGQGLGGREAQGNDAARAKAREMQLARENPGAAKLRSVATGKPAGADLRGGAGARRLPVSFVPSSADQGAEVAAPVQTARLKRRHIGILVLSAMLIWMPGAFTAWYLWTHAADQYESTAGFAIRTENTPTPFDFLGAFGAGSSSSSKDMDILNEFIGSQELVGRLDARLDLGAIFSKPQGDPLMTYDTSGTIEDLVKFWRRMVRVDYDNSTGLMTLTVYAFDPRDAQRIAEAVLEESSKTINDLSEVARDDTTKYAKAALDAALARVSDARAAITEFRVKHSIFDPTSDVVSQTSVLNTLNQQLISTQVELDLLKGAAVADDPRVQTANRRIDVIKARIADEQAKVGAGSDGDVSGYANLVSDYERLRVDQEFSEKAYLTALASYDAAATDAQHKTLYLATFIQPTLAEAYTAPDRPLLLITVMLLGFLAWAIVVLIYYSLRDRR